MQQQKSWDKNVKKFCVKILKVCNLKYLKENSSIEILFSPGISYSDFVEYYALLFCLFEPSMLILLQKIFGLFIKT